MDIMTLVKQRIAERPQIVVDEKVQEINKHRNEVRKAKMEQACKKYRESHREIINERHRAFNATPEAKAKSHEYYLAHKEEHLRNCNASRARSRERDPEGFAEHQRELKRQEYCRRKSEILAIQKKYRQNMTPEQIAHIKEYRKQYNAAHREHKQAYMREWKKRKMAKLAEQAANEAQPVQAAS